MALIIIKSQLSYHRHQLLLKKRPSKANRNAGPKKGGATVDLRDRAELSRAAKALKKDLANNPGKISDYLKISPKRTQGKIAGYRLMPGKNAEFFKASGLRSGDVAIQMNGLDLIHSK